MNKWKCLPFFFMYFISLSMVVLIDLVTAQFSLDRIGSSEYWSNILTVAIANLLVLLSSTFYDVDKLKETDRRILDDRKEIRQAIANDIDVDFKDFIVQDNLSRKITSWKNYINRKLRKLENKKASQKRDAAIQKLQSMITKEYIDKYIDSIKIKYYYIKMSQIISGFRSGDEVERLESGFNKVSKDILPKFLLSISLPIFISSFVMDVKDFSPVLLLTIASKLVSLISNFMNGKSYAKVYVNEVVLYNLDYRIKYIERYVSWKAKKKAGDTNETTII
ncbi:hypothetical protein KHQ81_14940 [Mycoplasmatota bacterium]|nr:hypothetical protein KHQ81_14940 [Mycoplasmatota bacterium]